MFMTFHDTVRTWSIYTSQDSCANGRSPAKETSRRSVCQVPVTARKDDQPPDEMSEVCSESGHETPFSSKLARSLWSAVRLKECKAGYLCFEIDRVQLAVYQSLACASVACSCRDVLINYFIIMSRIVSQLCFCFAASLTYSTA